MTHRILGLAAALGVTSSASLVAAQFSTIINVPPDAAPASIGSYTQLNLGDGGLLPLGFVAGDSEGSTENVEVNISGGAVRPLFRATSGAAVNVSGGVLESTNQFDAGSTLSVSGGYIGPELFGGGDLIVTGGVFFGFVGVSGDGTMRISGGSHGDGYSASQGGRMTLVGDGFELNGEPVAGLEAVGSTVTMSLPANSVLSGTLSDGSPIILDPRYDNELAEEGSLSLEVQKPPGAAPGDFVVGSGDDPVYGLREGQRLLVAPGGELPTNFAASHGSRVTIGLGATTGLNFEAIGAEVVVDGGTVGQSSDAFVGTKLTLAAGQLSRFFTAHEGSQVELLGGGVGGQFAALAGSLVHIGGSQVEGPLNFRSGSRVLLSAGALEHVAGSGAFASTGGAMELLHLYSEGTGRVAGGTTDRVIVRDGASLHLFGSDFAIDGADLTGDLTYGVPYEVDQRGLLLETVLLDGTPFEILLSTATSSVLDIVETDAELTVTLLLAGDLDRNGAVDAADRGLWVASFGDEVAAPGDGADGNFDGVIDAADYTVWRDAFLATSTTVPEPAGLLLATLVVGLVSRRTVRGRNS